MSEVSPAYIKGLFFHLVKEVGSCDAAAAFLGISQQRVSQLQNIQIADMPTIMQVVTLERVVGQAIVTGPLAKSATGQPDTADVARETREVTYAAVELQRRVDEGADKRTIQTGLLRVRKEADDVQHALDRRND
jgi:hypothetical protein